MAQKAVIVVPLLANATDHPKTGSELKLSRIFHERVVEVAEHLLPVCLVLVFCEILLQVLLQHVILQSSVEVA